jgi:dipeptidyl aminopeptidase/acylaminoacyl peptidase
MWFSKWMIAMTISSAAGLPMVNADQTTLIPRQTLFGNPQRASVRISPDGEHLSYLAPVDGVLNVWVGPVGDPAAAKPITQDKGRGVRIYFWAYDGRHVLYLQDKGGDENWRVYSVDVGSREVRDLTPLEKVQARIQEVSHRLPNEILVALNDRDPQLHDIYRVNLTTGERQLALENEGFLGFETDADYHVRFAERTTPDGGREILQRTADGGWKPFIQLAPEDALSTHLAGFDKTGRVLRLIDSRGRNTSALTEIQLDDGKQTVIADDPRADVSGAIAHPTEFLLEAVSFTYEREQWRVLDPKVEPDFAALRAVADGDFEVTSRTLDDSKWIVACVLDNGPVKYYLYERPARKASFLFTNRPELEKLALAHMHPVVIKSRDGLNLVSYLSLPPKADPDNYGRPASPVPLVLNVHGGPWARDTWGYDPYHQWLTDRGYAVLSVNYRGSTGFGKEFTNAGDHEWAGKAQDDLVDAVQWAIQERVADPQKIAIMGGSYGGYATLVGLTFTPDLFACGVDIVGPSSLLTLLDSIPPYWKPMLDMFVARIGDPRTEAGRKFLLERSPITRVDQIHRPLLIGQGANDPRVKQAESDQIVAAMQEKKIPVTYVLFSDEGHGFARPENNMAFNAVTEAFLARQLGGRFEPIGKDFEGSTIKVPAGADQVPGLAEALKQE